MHRLPDNTMGFATFLFLRQPVLGTAEAAGMKLPQAKHRVKDRATLADDNCAYLRQGLGPTSIDFALLRASRIWFSSRPGTPEPVKQ